MEYSEPTDIQQKLIPVLLDGRDMIGQAQTGTGKTAAFGILLAEVIDTREKHIQGVVLVPTRELAVQVSIELRRIGQVRGIGVVAVYGGQRIEPQITDLARGVHIVVATPGRMLDHMQRGTVAIDKVKVAILDEADEMLDIGFAHDIDTILRSTPRARQTAMFSATMPVAIKRLAARHLQNPQLVRVGRESQAVASVEQVYYEVAERDHRAALEELLVKVGNNQTIIFCRTRHGVETVANFLERKKFTVQAIHGRMRQSQRDRAMRAFRSSKCEFLVATNIAARGLDIPTVSQVINYDLPQSVEEYVHRIGRTARMGRPGVAYTFVSEWDSDTFTQIKRHMGKDLTRGMLSISPR
jgi:ATP-dependent RNA helicase DeaD